MALKIGQIGKTPTRTVRHPNSGAFLAGSQPVAVPTRSTGAQLTSARFGRNTSHPTVPLSVHSVAAQQTPHGAVQRQGFVSPLKPQRFG